MTKILYIPNNSFLTFQHWHESERIIDFKQSKLYQFYYPTANNFLEQLCEATKMNEWLCEATGMNAFKIVNNLPSSVFIEEFEVIDE